MDIFDKAPYSSIDEAFHKNLPATLYMTHYELHEWHSQYSPNEWRRYLKENERFILSEVSAMTEASARQALSRLSAGKLTAQDVSAIKQILDRSEQINSQERDQRTFVMLQFDGTESPDDDIMTADKRQKVMQQNSKNIRDLYGLDYMSASERQRFHDREDISLNGDGTLHFTDPQAMSELDSAYIRLFNPENVQSNELIQINAPDEVDVQ